MSAGITIDILIATDSNASTGLLAQASNLITVTFEFIQEEVQFFSIS